MKRGVWLIVGVVISLAFVLAIIEQNSSNLLFSPGTCRDCPNLATRGDANNDCRINQADIQYVTRFLFRNGRGFCNEQRYYESADVNGDNRIDVTDTRYLANWLYSGGPAPKPLSQPVSECVDTDGGIFPDVLGNITNSTGIYPDYCWGDSVREGYCENNVAVHVTRPCSNGCANGVCKPDSGLPTICTDSDNGLNFNINGRVDVTNRTGIFTYVDSCYNSTTLREHSCNVDNTIRYSTSFYCPNGCTNGACVNDVGTTNLTCADFGYQKGQVRERCVGTSNSAGYNLIGCYNESRSCIDYDNGLNYNLRANVTYSVVATSGPNCIGAGGGSGSGNIKIDQCSGNVLAEQICNSDKTPGSVNYTCLNGCTNGRCVESVAGGKILNVSLIINKSAGIVDDIVELVDYYDKAASYRAILTSEGSGIITIAGRVYTLRYYGSAISDWEDRYIEIEDSPDFPVEAQTRGRQRAFRNSIVVIGNPVYNGRIARVRAIFNSSGLSDDKVEFSDLENGNIYRADLTSEGVGTIAVGGIAYSVRYYGLFNDESNYVKIKDPRNQVEQKIFYRAYGLFPNNT